jgi:hypothetical protein
MTDSPPTPTAFEPLSAQARQILDTLLTATFPGRDEVAQQVAVAQGRRLDEHGCLELSAREAAAADVIRRIPVEAQTEDVDGMPIHVLLHVVDGYVDELEFFREDSGPLRAPIRPDDLRVIVL